MAVDKDHDVGPQMGLFVENITAQTGVGGECGLERVAQHHGRGVDLRYIGEGRSCCVKTSLAMMENYTEPAEEARMGLEC